MLDYRVNTDLKEPIHQRTRTHFTCSRYWFIQINYLSWKHSYLWSFGSDCWALVYLFQLTRSRAIRNTVRPLCVCLGISFLATLIGSRKLKRYRSTFAVRIVCISFSTKARALRGFCLLQPVNRRSPSKTYPLTLQINLSKSVIT